MKHFPRALAGVALGAACLGALWLVPATAPAQAPAFTDQQRQAIERIVREYLLSNPEILQDVMAELERRQSEAQKVAQEAALAQSKDALLRSPHDIVAGNPAGDVTVVEFFDYNCGFCKKALGDMRSLLKSDPKMRLVLKDFPVLGPDSVEASRVSLAVGKQLKGEKLFEYHVKLMETRGRVNGERALAVAKEMGVDLTRLQKDVDSPEVRAVLQENVALGDRLGLTGTPAFIIGNEVISGAVGSEPLRQTVSSVRQCGKAVC